VALNGRDSGNCAASAEANPDEPPDAPQPLWPIATERRMRGTRLNAASVRACGCPAQLRCHTRLRSLRHPRRRAAHPRVAGHSPLPYPLAFGLKLGRDER